MSNNYTLGRGKIWFSKFLDDGVTPAGYRYLGNTPECSFSIQAENLDHFSADEGIKEKDESVALSTTRTGQFSTDNIDPANLAFFFFGADDALAVSAATIGPESLGAVKVGYSYQIGATDSVPQGQTNLTIHTSPSTKIILKDETNTTTYVDGTDYTVDLNTGLVTILSGGAIADDDVVHVTYKTTAQSIERVISGSTPIEGSMKFIATNPKGKLFDYFMPWVKITPNGDFALKGDTWQVIPFNLEILKQANREAFYVTSRVAA